MNVWKTESVNLGDIEYNKRYIIIFECNEILDIKSLRSSCGCSKPRYDKVNNRIIVTYNPKAIPARLVKRGYYITTKFIYVKLNNNIEYKLSFTATVHKKI